MVETDGMTGAQSTPGAHGAGPVRPDYDGGSIVNLMASIESALGDPGQGAGDAEAIFAYPQLRALPASELGERVVLWVIDGLGYEYLSTTGANDVMFEHTRGSMTSVFPSTTSSAITTFMTGLAPRQHAMVGWFMWLEALGEITAALPFIRRGDHVRLDDDPAVNASVFDARPLSDRLIVPCEMLMPAGLTHTTYSQAYQGSSRMHGYQSLQALAGQIADWMRQPGPGYLYAYWPQFDSLSHRFGVGSEQVRRHFFELDMAFEWVVRETRGAGATLVVTADHGFVDTTDESWIRTDLHAPLAETLRLPLTGEMRAAYCHIKPGCEAAFESAAAELLDGRARVVRSGELVEEGWFGPGTSSAQLMDRIGDYTLVMNGHDTVRDVVQGESEAPPVIGVHGGVSRAEMLVPLIVV